MMNEKDKWQRQLDAMDEEQRADYLDRIAKSGGLRLRIDHHFAFEVAASLLLAITVIALASLFGVGGYVGDIANDFCAEFERCTEVPEP